MEETKVLKNGSKQIFKFGWKMYTESGRKLHVKYNISYKPVSLTLFSNQNHFIATLQARERQSCLCITCLKPHIMIKAINVYWKFHDNRIASVTNSVYSRFKNWDSVSWSKWWQTLQVLCVWTSNWVIHWKGQSASWVFTNSSCWWL